MAATDLVKNFHAIATTLTDHPSLREVWNEADPAFEIPEGSWQIFLENYQNSHYHDLLNEAIEKLMKNQRQLEGYWKEGDTDFLALYPQGISPFLQEAEEGYALLRAGFAEEDLSQDEKDLRDLVERSKTLRSTLASSAVVVRETIARDKGVIRGNVHIRLHIIEREYLDLREALYRLAFKHVAKLTRHDIPYPREFRLKAIGISLLAAVTLYENAVYLQTYILTIPVVKNLLNQGDPAWGISPNFWNHIEREFVRVEYRNLFEAGIQVMEEKQKLPTDSLLDKDPFFAYVSGEIASSAALKEIHGERSLTKNARALRYHLMRLNKIGMGTLQKGNLEFSKSFGSLIGMIELRKGKLFNQPHWVQFIKERLKPGDILLDRSPFRSSDLLIPGYFGHVAMYVGTATQLSDLDLLIHPWVSPHVPQVARGKTIVEAIREGTDIKSVEYFLNTDDLAILRPKTDKIPEADVMQAIALAFTHIGKKYDFRLDTNTWDTIICTELAFHSYVNVRWPFTRILSTYTITPDDVAVLAGSDSLRPFELITFIRDGRVVHDPTTGLENEDSFIHLLGKRYAKAIL